MTRDLFLGAPIDPGSGERGDASLLYDPSDLTTHGVIVGMTGSGKTGLGVVLLEELLRSGVPVLVIDPKGDMGNLLLRFPELRPDDFAPWVEAAPAEAPAVAEAQASLWREGLAGWGLGESDLSALGESAEFSVYTPGSTAGRPINLIGDLRAPQGADAETRQDEIEGTVTSLLQLAGIDADPLSTPEHVLLANLIGRAWEADRSLDLATLIGQVLDPPMRKLGVFEIDAFLPPTDRRALAMRLNNLAASPSFAAWSQGPPLDIGALLRTPAGKPRASILYLAHLSEEERQFVVALVISKLISWMRAQSGTTDLRALVYMDEVFGFVPPTAQPPAKKPILTMLKQARAYGVGMVLSTQNPVDLDYKAMSNTGTWMVGRLQTERDKARVLEAIASAGGEVDVAAFDRLISGLGKRQFVLHNTHDRGGPQVFTTRWAMSYLRGPLTRDQVRMLEPPPVPAAARTEQPAARQSPPLAVAASQAAPPLGENESLVAPEVAAAVPVRWLDPAAPWATEFGVTPTPARWEAALAATVHLTFDDTRAGVDHQEVWEAILHPLPAEPDITAATAVDFDARDLREAPSVEAPYALPAMPLGNARLFTGLARDLRQHLYRSREIEVLRNLPLKLYGRVGESEDAFLARCREVAADRADTDTAKLKTKIDRRIDRAKTAIARAEDRLDQLKVDTRSRRSHELLAGASDLLGGLLGGGNRTKSLAGKVKGVSSRRSMARRTEQRKQAAEERVEDEVQKLADLEADLADEILAIDARWDDAAETIETVSIGLEKSDVQVDELALVWLPVD